ncbi:phage tail tape measure protein [Caulobacter mirabilis]|uniref:Phage tail tape measure protein n=1 Tax=Caulobacter mirabilis TaxID=69666 RepID=A0A2D2AVU9_9CAUL|nr:phage tail tape measure protein [Caulobacter mirabilis]ATQ42138.1 phage tail tape measure protein [Caulobacter mirabilis]
MTQFDDGGLEGLPRQAAEAAAAMEALRQPAERAASAIDEAFGKAGDSLARSLSRAAADGKVTLAELAEAVIAAVNAAAGAGGGGRGGGLAEALSAVLSGGGFGGARADGGGVLGGRAYLVGERGPEVFRPAGAGTIEPAAGGGATINVTVRGEGGAALLRSETQIAAALARAASLGARNL